ncbi:hypothetical protein HME9304_00534 [Flagellimonas maritima]|uniref:DUF3667 domain-containing protein n=1 Tax=Flagellimonas maritima TaxID=1383885 RepID=A0A2Z4LNV5_9FLAO|nr:DUF3667 domain-containing protein [Allomuricauda aurantiaca]AWX43545.1 hypothetical protein HME9304_00534 [Allomuricauda aurantiaca]
MACKNCNESLRTDYSFCPSCGAKVIKKRISLKSVWQDLSYQVFNLDNTFLKTFRHLFSNPDVVIGCYISGTRKKYMNPVSYFAIAITLSGLLFFILRDVYHVNLTKSSFSDKQTANLDFIFDYQGLLSYVIMPIYALMTWLLFIDRRKFNYTEHLVANAYIIGQTSFVQVLLCIPLFGLFDITYDIFNWLFLVVTIIYQFYIFGKLHQTAFLSTFFRAFIYLILFIFIMMAIGILIITAALLVGYVNLEDFAPK